MLYAPWLMMKERLLQRKCWLPSPLKSHPSPPQPLPPPPPPISQWHQILSIWGLNKFISLKKHIRAYLQDMKNDTGNDLALN